MKTKNADYLRKHKRKHRLLALSELGGECVECGYDDIRALEFDHINNDGYKERGPRDATYYKNLIKEKDRFQVLCSNCNTIKQWKHKRQ